MPPNRPSHRPGLQTRQGEVPHPSHCCGNPYSQDMRTLVEAVRMVGPISPDVQQFVETLQLNHIFPSQRTQARWENTNALVGHTRPCRHTGNQVATRLRGQDLIYLALYRLAYPKATYAEINAFLYNVNFGNIYFKFYSHSQISEAEKRIGLSYKKGSTTAYQAFLPQNLQKRWDYWNLPFPIGISDISRRFIVDLDECGIFLQTVNRCHSKAYVGVRVRDAGPYSRSEKCNLMMAISGENGTIVNPSRRWAMLWEDGGTTVQRMLEFVQGILNDIGHADGNEFYVFTMDNLNSHKNVAVVALIHLYGHGVVYCAPYWSVDGSIEYVFNTLQTLLKARLHQIRSNDDLRQAIIESIQGMIDFAGYFCNVGFVNN